MKKLKSNNGRMAMKIAMTPFLKLEEKVAIIANIFEPITKQVMGMIPVMVEDGSLDIDETEEINERNINEVVSEAVTEGLTMVSDGYKYCNRVKFARMMCMISFTLGRMFEEGSVPDLRNDHVEKVINIIDEDD